MVTAWRVDGVMVIGKYCHPVMLLAHLLQEPFLPFMALYVPTIQHQVQCATNCMGMVRGTLGDRRHCPVMVMLGIVQEVVGNAFKAFWYGSRWQGIIANIMVANIEDQGDKPMQFGIKHLKHSIEVIPTIVARPHAIIISEIPTHNYHMRIILH